MTTISSPAQSPGSLGEPRASRPGPGGMAPGSPGSNTRAAWAGFCVIAAVALVFLLWEGRGDTEAWQIRIDSPEIVEACRLAGL